MLAKLINAIARLLKRLGTCGNAGLIVGMLTGGLLALLDFLDGPLAPTLTQIIRLWLVTALFGWLVLLAIFVGLVRWRFSAVALPSLVNAVLVAGLTLLICQALGAFAYAWWIGILVGLLVGRLLCLINNLLQRR
jgi:hypothetical protein